MKNILIILVLVIMLPIYVRAETESPRIVRRATNGKGLLCLFQNKNILFLEGTPEEMGTAHGELRKEAIRKMTGKILLVAFEYLVNKDDWFFSRIEEVMRRTSPFTPPRFMEECDAMSAAAGIALKDGRHINFFPEMFHCSGVAVRNSATADGQLIHARVLDYMSGIGLQRHAQLTVFMPSGYNTWVSQGYAGLIGTVTAMNEHGLAMGEMGGKGAGKWDGLPMSFMMRRVMEECASVEEALRLMRSIPLTCEYYYILSDRERNMAAVAAVAGKPLRVFAPGEQVPELPQVPQDTVYISVGERAEALSRRLLDEFGKIDAAAMIEIIRRPVAMNSNLHNMIFLPESGTMYFSDAGRDSLACDEPYVRVNLHELLKFYRSPAP